MKQKTLRVLIVGLCATWIAAHCGFAQEVVLDRQVRAGDLTLFPSAKNDNQYYYVAGSARLATGERDRPQFSFLRYVEPNVTADAESDKGAGGGIVHAVVEIGVTDEQLAEARRELSRANPSATLVGPVPFKSGTFALISSFANEDSDFTDQVLGVGPAPLLEKQGAAISLSLTRKGAEVLWESFHTETPDISFSFNMEIDGFRSPKQAILEANFDRIYSHNNFQAGVATPYLQAEIETAFEDLRTQGAIRITQVGEDEKMDALIQTAYNRLTELMFQRAESSGAASPLAGVAGSSESMLDKASALLDRRRQETRTENEAIRKRNQEADDRRGRAAQARTTADQSKARVDEVAAGVEQLDARVESARRLAANYNRRAREAATDERRKAYEALAGRFREQAERYERIASERKTELESLRAQHGEHDTAATAAEAAGSTDREEAQEMPSLTVVASYRMKRVRQRGEFKIDLNKYSAGSLAMRFDQNIGDLTRHLDDENIFRTVDIGNSAFRQRELPVFIDGLNVTDFGEYVNFVTILLRKRHENGTETTDEVRVDRLNFQQSANNFKLSYRKLGDGDLGRFLDYEYRVLWNFFGGVEVDEPWQSSARSAIALSPPYQRRTIFLEGDPEIVEQERIRSVDIRIYYKLGGTERTQRIALRPRNGEGLSQRVSFMLPADSYDYEYEMSWRLDDGTRVRTGRVATDEASLFFDEVHEG